MQVCQYDSGYVSVKLMATCVSAEVQSERAAKRKAKRRAKEATDKAAADARVARDDAALREAVAAKAEGKAGSGELCTNSWHTCSGAETAQTVGELVVVLRML